MWAGAVLRLMRQRQRRGLLRVRSTLVAHPTSNRQRTAIITTSLDRGSAVVKPGVRQPEHRARRWCSTRHREVHVTHCHVHCHA
eukprot:3937751-Rhodomonas_salina.1